MAGSVQLQYASQMTVNEVLGTNIPAASSPTIVHSGFNTTQTLNGASTPPASLVAAFVQALTSGAATVDLTALLGTNGATVSGSGLKVQAIKIIALGTNANTLRIKTGASNGYNLGNGAFDVTLAPGQELLLYGNNACPTIDSTHKTLDLTGTGAQSLDIIIVMG